VLKHAVERVFFRLSFDLKEEGDIGAGYACVPVNLLRADWFSSRAT
jgi:hypothetical protein